MGQNMKRLEISQFPDLLQLVESVRDSGQPCILLRDGEDIAVALPFKPAIKRRPRRERTAADYAAFRAAAGSWKDVDTDELIADTYESRRQSSRPPVNGELKEDNHDE